MDPLDAKEYLPETYAFIRNCTLADVGLHINIGATYWAESETVRLWKGTTRSGMGKWGTYTPSRALKRLLNPRSQTVHFIAHDYEKDRLCKLVHDYSAELCKRKGWKLTGTSGTCKHINEFLSYTPHLKPVGTKASGRSASTVIAHGPTGGDLVIADEVREQWPVDEKDPNDPKAPKDVRKIPITHTILFFIDYHHAQPHEADVHVLLRTCLNPHRGVHLILNNRTAIHWAGTLRSDTFT